jgi:hypothetical protein
MKKALEVIKINNVIGHHSFSHLLSPERLDEESKTLNVDYEGLINVVNSDEKVVHGKIYNL